MMEIEHLSTDKPQSRDVKGREQLFARGDIKQKYSYAYAIPAIRCENCFFYKVDKIVEPTAYYCRIDFFSDTVVQNQMTSVPNDCDIYKVKYMRALMKHNQRCEGIFIPPKQ